MIWRVLADLVLLLHLTFILFVILGGFLAIRWSWLKWAHLPAIVWAAALEFGGWICPLTPLEIWLLQKGGKAGYTGGFIEHYGIPLIYPTGLTPTIQWYLGIGIIALNVMAYTICLWSTRRKP